MGSNQRLLHFYLLHSTKHAVFRSFKIASGASPARGNTFESGTFRCPVLACVVCIDIQVVLMLELYLQLKDLFDFG